jgi:hypothetical protein
MGRSAAIFVTTLAVLAVVVLIGSTGSASASPGQLTLNLNPVKWCSSAAPNGGFDVTSNYPAYFHFGCSGAFEVRGDPPGSACCNQYVGAQINAPPGFVLTGAESVGTVTNLNNGSGWTGGSFFNNGGSHWSSGSNQILGDPPFTSSYWGIDVSCPPGLTCAGAGAVSLSSVTLTAAEYQGPSIAAVGTDNLWNQNRPGEWVWNPPGDSWPMPFAASDPSGVCSMSATIAGTRVAAPSTPADTSQWQQCPDPTWSPNNGAGIDTRDPLIGGGSLPLVISATNAAGLTTSYSESLNVDNDPVALSLTTPNDLNPNVWVNHAVTLDTTATGGPSGLGGIACTNNSVYNRLYVGPPFSIDGDGIHNVVCTAWNNAVGPQGQPNTDTQSLTLHIDESPPEISFEPQNPSDLTGLIVDATDSESGVASGSIEMAPAGTNEWTALPTSFNGAQFAAHFDDSQRTGPYVFRATACDNVGNCDSTTEHLTLPVRAASDSEVSLTRIVNPIHRQVILKRVLVGWHWATIRRGNETVRVKRGGHFETIKVIKYVETCTTKRVKTGPHTWQTERTCAPPHVRTTTTLTEPYGHSVTIHGLYTTNQGVPIAGQQVNILAAPDNGFDDFSQLATATTAADGSWSATLPPGPSRIIRATTAGTATILPSSGQVTALVPAMIKLIQVWPRHVAWGGTVHLVGQLFGGYLPAGGALVRLRIGYKSTYSTYGVEEHVTGDGRFSTVATFGPGDPSVLRTYWFQIASLPMGDYPYAPAASQRIPVIVGGHPG